jgi:hypothetical protein
MAWFKLVIDMIAEVIGFQFGFYGDVDLFCEVVWRYIDSIQPIEKSIPSDQYFIRTFFVYVYENISSNKLLVKLR